MASRSRERSFNLALGLRSCVAAAFAFGALQLFTATRLYAAGAALACLALLTLWDTARLRGSGGSAPHASAPDFLWLQQHDRAVGLLDSVTVAIVALGADGRVTFTNRAARLLARTEIATLGDIASLDQAAVRQILAMRPGGRDIVTLSDGRLMLVWAVGFSIPGKPPERLISLQSVAGELDAVQLRAWHDMARVLTHEIMNSLTPIASLSESTAKLMTGKKGVDPKIGRAVNAIARRSSHLIDFVQRYRQVAELPPPRLQALSASEFVAMIEPLILPVLQAHRIEFEIDIDPPDLTFHADPELMSQAILNLLLNAAEAVRGSDQPNIAFTIAQRGSEVVCAIADNGPGIAPELVEEIFVPFFTTKEAGSGVGLTLARQVALAHHGRLEVKDNPGAGAVFAMHLPAEAG
jgi:two-component system nitrogen regulation sensor histidine kinase NtrY